MSNPVYNGSDKRLQQLFENGGGGGGTTVVANPSGEATDELEKLQVGQTIYSIPEGGGGGTPIPWTFVGDATGSVAIDISGVWTDADEFCVAVFCDGDSANMLVTTIAKSSIPSSNGRFGLGGDPNIALVEASPTQIKLTYAKWSSIVTSTTVTKVYYRKKITGGGSGSSTLAGLTDVELTSPTNGQVLTYNNGDWVNANGGGSGGSGGTCYLNTMYSTTEKKVGYWTDGKPLYQKVIECGAGPNNAVKAVAHGISNIETIIPLIALGKGSTYTLPIPYTDSAVNTQISLFVDSTNINLWSGSDRSSYMVRVILQYTKTTDSAESNPQQGGIIYLPTIYSEEEREVGVWVNGKPLYQKSITLTQIPNRELLTINHGIANIDEVTEVKGICFANLTVAPNHSSTMLPRIQDNSTNANMGIDVDRTVIYLKGRNEAFSEIYDKIVVTIQYTKTTDTAGSGSWTPSGTPAVHYSTNEQVVGTWIDGKTLYEATIEVNNPTKQTFGNYYSYDANYSGHNIDYVQCIAKQCHDSHDQRWYDLPYHRIIDTESIWCQGMKADSTGQYSFAVFFRTSEQYNIDKIRYTIQYTKSS